MNANDRLSLLRSGMPTSGLLAEKEWRASDAAFPLSERHVTLLGRLGPVLQHFVQGCNLLYRWSVQGKAPTWIADLLDRGKPPELVALSRRPALANLIPRVIRPDLLWTESGFALCELDSVPGGIGVTAWLQEQFSLWDSALLGGAGKMKEGFARLFPTGDVVVSEEASSYRPEMEYLVGADRVCAAEDYRCSDRAIYRFFECFDWERLSTIRESFDPDRVPMTPPPKPYLEEKLWLALFWFRPLRDFWRRQLTDKGFQLLREIIPQSWILDPSPLPPQAVYPGLEINDWRELGHFSQSERDLVLKVSGFSPLAWGSRGVFVGSDLAQAEWQKRIEHALEEFGSHPWLLQRFAKGALVEHRFFTSSGEEERMTGRVRISPYYFVLDGKTELGGALATICPADKKLVHGMRDAILVPATRMEGAAEPTRPRDRDRKMGVVP
ncbi:H-NS histone family protein [Methylacidimicrobium tartarophylax]|uniref:Glutathionylspermidine synthase pre-ATP-grasp-like domain-containing protein n=1 Tax=Methylacidimicrobium tartarophylax TaxID=1041768 RepID=A0A5E6MDW8_9BACT|nr:H-NS histone family protein [Methylacidimicrobium tartarophylax]VVM07403.1 hypothetical protein MAMT_01741 [Methylacidimicrobium tartarophylax]